jgi:hypothetical protein
MTDYQPVTAGYPPTSDADGPPLQDKATDAAEAARQGGADVVQTATEKTKDVVQETSKQARDLVGEAREQVRQQAGAQHRNLVTRLRSLSDELGALTAGNERSGVATEAVTQLRDRVHGAADWLEVRDPGDLIEELRRFARRHPGAFLLGAVAAGVAAGRLTRGVVAAHADDTNATQNGIATQPALAPTSDYPPTDEYASEFSGYAAPTGNGEAGYGTPAGYGARAGYGTERGYETQRGYGTRADYGTQLGYSTPPAGGYPQSDSPEGREGWR